VLFPEKPLTSNSEKDLSSESQRALMPNLRLWVSLKWNI